MNINEQTLYRNLKSEDVQFYWCITTADFEGDDVEVHDHLLKMIVELFVTIRGFSYMDSAGDFLTCIVHG